MEDAADIEPVKMSILNNCLKFSRLVNAFFFVPLEYSICGTAHDHDRKVIKRTSFHLKKKMDKYFLALNEYKPYTYNLIIALSAHCLSNPVSVDLL